MSGVLPESIIPLLMPILLILLSMLVLKVNEIQ